MELGGSVVQTQLSKGREMGGGGGYFNIWAIGSVCAVEGTTVPDMSPAFPYYLQTIK